MTTKNEHGGGRCGISRCHCALCRARRREYRRSLAVEQSVWERKLDETKVLEIKRLLYLGETQSNIAEKYEIVQTMVSLINRKKRWKHVVFHPTRQDRRVRDRTMKLVSKQIA